MAWTLKLVKIEGRLKQSLQFTFIFVLKIFDMNLNFNKNEDHNKLLLSDLRKRYVKVKLGGGASKIETLGH